MTDMQKHKAFMLMNRLGGSFAAALADAWFAADPTNRAIIEGAFGATISEYHQMVERYGPEVIARAVKAEAR